MSGSMKLETVAIVSTGTEILQGMYPDTNAQWLAKELCALGLRVVAETVAPDDGECVETAVRFAMRRADLVVCSGGLGPTGDDVNCAVFARCCGAALVEDKKVLAMIAEHFARRGMDVPSGNDSQAMVPEGATVFYNEWGTAPGWFLPCAAERGMKFADGTGSAALMALPGPPSELKPMFAAYARELLAKRVCGARFSRTHILHIYGYPESEIGARVAGLFGARGDVDYTILARPNGIDLCMTGHAASREALDELIAEVEAQTLAAVPANSVYGADDETLPAVVGAMLAARGETVCTAESCTGGLISKMLTDVSGSSVWFGHGYVTYANSAKMQMLGVREGTLGTHGAVSAETACEMAEGARVRSGATYALATTGVAGPTGARDEKPVGLVYTALATPEGTTVKKNNFLFGREGNRVHSAMTALNMLRLHLLSKK